MIMKNETYDGLKNFATMILPAIGTLYFALAEIWGLPNGEKIVGTVAAVCTFLGVFLKVSNVKYNRQKDEQRLLDEECTNIQFDALAGLADEIKALQDENTVDTGAADNLTVCENESGEGYDGDYRS